MDVTPRPKSGLVYWHYGFCLKSFRLLQLQFSFDAYQRAMEETTTLRARYAEDLRLTNIELDFKTSKYY